MKVGHFVGIFSTVVFVGAVFDVPCSQVEHFGNFAQVVLKRGVGVIFWVYFGPLVELFVTGNPSDPILKHYYIKINKSILNIIIDYS